MGCDIHAWIEVVDRKRSYTCAIARVYLDRDYRMFERLCGVRGNVKRALAPPRGLPDQLSSWCAGDVEEWHSDGHSHSWLSAAEFKKAVRGVQHAGWFVDASDKAAVAMLACLAEQGEARIVFFFDN